MLVHAGPSGASAASAGGATPADRNVRAADDVAASVAAIVAHAFAALFNSLADVPQACLHIGSIFIVKYTDHNGPVVLSRNLSQLELRTLERYPEIQLDPRRAMDSLAPAISTLEHNVEGAAGPAQGFA